MNYKNIYLLLLAVIGLNLNIMAQKKNVITKEQSIYIDVPIEQLWKITALDFANIGAWSAGVNSSEGQGAGINGSKVTERVCQPSYKGFKATTERFIKYNPNDYSFTYQIPNGLPKMVTYAENVWKHKKKGNGTELTMAVNMELKGFMGWLLKGVMEKQMGKILVENLEELKIYAETGKLHPRKIAANEKYQKQLAKKSGN